MGKSAREYLDLYFGEETFEGAEKRDLIPCAVTWFKKDEQLGEALPDVIEDEEDDAEDEEEDVAAVPEAVAEEPVEEPAAEKLAEGTARGQLHLLPKPLSQVHLPVVSLAHHHHIIHFVDVDPAYCPARRVTNLLSNSGSDSGHHYHTSRHQHRLKACKLHVPSSERTSVYWEPYVRMRSSTVGTFSNFTLYNKLYYVEMSHHFIHVHEVYCKDICLNPQGDPHRCPKHPKSDHGCPLLHIKARLIDDEGFSRSAVVMETNSRTTTDCTRFGSTDFAHFQHSHTHEHTLHMTLHKGNPSEDPHDPYYNFLLPGDPPHGLPCSPFST